MDFTQTLRDHGLKSTPQRTALLAEIYKAGHIDIEKLHQNILFSIKIPLGTLYRAVSELSVAGILNTISINGQKTIYEITKGHHGHFVCDLCGKIDDIIYDSDSVLKNSQLPKDYKIKALALTLHGICQRCG